MCELFSLSSSGKVEALLMMAHSSVVPGGGASPETTLQILSECRGDFLVNTQFVLWKNNVVFFLRHTISI